MIKFFEGKYAFLSNFYESPFEYEGVVYPTNEHFFQAMKTLDLEERKKIAAAKTPGKAKRLGRKVSLRPDWEEVKVGVMSLGLSLKFAIPELREALLATGDAELEEGNWWHDNIYGNCKCDRCKEIEGKNMLGLILMKVREELKNEEK